MYDTIRFYGCIGYVLSVVAFLSILWPFPPAENLQTLCWSIHQMETWLKPVSSQCCLVPIPLACICNFHWMSLWTCGPHLTQKCSKLMFHLHYNNQVNMQLCETSETNWLWLWLWTCTVCAGHSMSLWCLILWQLAPDVQSQDAPKSSNWLKDPCHCSQMRLLHMDCHPALVCTCVQMSYTKRLLNYGKVCQYVLTDG